jgi:hypothetical protein
MTANPSFNARYWINAAFAAGVVLVAISLVIRYGKRTLQKVYRDPNGCAADDNFFYKDPNLHYGDC